MSSIPNPGRESELNISENDCESISNQNAKRILAFLKEGEKRITWDQLRSSNVTIICGNTGSAKTTLAHFLSGANEDLISYEVGEGSGEFIIYHKDDNIQTDLTVESKTTYAGIFIDPKTGNIIVDLGGFNDAGRNEAYDLIVAFFIKRVLETARSVKIILTADHSSVRKGVNRYDFLILLQHVTVLLKNIEKYLDGVALIATKVDCNDNVSDASIISNIARFLTEVEQFAINLRNSQQIYSPKFTDEEKLSFIRNVPILIDALLQKNDAGYSRLGIFKRPNAPGPVSEIQRCLENKTNLEAMLKKLKFVQNADDFGYSISPKTKLIVRDLADEICENVEYSLSQMVKELIAYYERTILILSEDKTVLKNHLSTYSEGLARIRSTGESSSLKDLISNIQTNLPQSCRLVVRSFLVDIENLGKFLNFLGKLGAGKFTFCSQKWIEALEVAITYVKEALASVSEAVQQSAFSFYEWLKQVLNSFKKKCQNVYKDVVEFLNGL